MFESGNKKATLNTIYNEEIKPIYGPLISFNIQIIKHKVVQPFPFLRSPSQEVLLLVLGYFKKHMYNQAFFLSFDKHCCV